MVGRSLIKSSELQSIITDQQVLGSAIQAFRTKYSELPGDMTRATSFWGTDPAGCPNLGTWGLVPRAATCNGNGNGFIQNPGSDYGVSAMYEQVYAWQHLANAGLIKGAFTGTPGPASYVDMRPGINIPAGKVPNSGFELYSFVASSAKASWFLNPINNQHFIVYGGVVGGTGEAFSRITTTADALFMDKKIDDGKPGTGILTSTNSTFGTDYPTCSDTDSINTAVYNVALTNPTCVLLFKLDL